MGHFLTRRETRTLKLCGFDISKVNSGVSSLWMKEQKLKSKSMTEVTKKFYPKPEDKVYYKKMIYRGAGSPKFNVYFLQDGKEVKSKTKKL